MPRRHKLVWFNPPSCLSDPEQGTSPNQHRPSFTHFLTVFSDCWLLRRAYRLALWQFVDGMVLPLPYNHFLKFKHAGCKRIPLPVWLTRVSTLWCILSFFSSCLFGAVPVVSNICVQYHRHGALLFSKKLYFILVIYFILCFWENEAGVVW